MSDEKWTAFLPCQVYEISDQGNVRRKEELVTLFILEGKKTVKKYGGTILRQTESKYVPAGDKKKKGRPGNSPGMYFTVSATIGIAKKNWEFRTADQVLLHFVANPNNYRAFRYINGDYRNVKASNLEWVPDSMVPVELLIAPSAQTKRDKTCQRTPLLCVPPPQIVPSPLDAAFQSIFKRRANEQGS